AMSANLLVGLPVAHEQHLLALGAFQPEILRRLLAGHQRAQFRSDEIGQPVHGGSIARLGYAAKSAPETGKWLHDFRGPLDFAEHLPGLVGRAELLRRGRLEVGDDGSLTNRLVRADRQDPLLAESCDAELDQLRLSLIVGRARRTPVAEGA